MSPIGRKVRSLGLPHVQHLANSLLVPTARRLRFERHPPLLTRSPRSSLVPRLPLSVARCGARIPRSRSSASCLSTSCLSASCLSASCSSTSSSSLTCPTCHCHLRLCRHLVLVSKSMDFPIRLSENSVNQFSKVSCHFRHPLHLLLPTLSRRYSLPLHHL